MNFLTGRRELRKAEGLESAKLVGRSNSAGNAAATPTTQNPKEAASMVCPFPTLYHFGFDPLSPEVG